MPAAPFRPALLVVDFQEDFCPPAGALPVPDARAIAPAVNALLALPFVLRLASRDAHPRGHVSFAANHPPGTRAAVVRRAGHPPHESPLWPVHCVAGTPGARLVPELHAHRLHAVLDKGTDARVEMYSAFYDALGRSDSGLAARLRAARVSHVYVAGLAADYCVRATAEHARDEGFAACIVDDATRPVDPDAWPEARRRLREAGVAVVSSHGPEVARVRALAGQDQGAAEAAPGEKVLCQDV